MRLGSLVKDLGLLLLGDRRLLGSATAYPHTWLSPRVLHLAAKPRISLGLRAVANVARQWLSLVPLSL